MTLLDSAAVPSRLPRIGAMLGVLPDELVADVEAWDILTGLACNGDCCALANAVKRALFKIGVHFVSITVCNRYVEVILAWGQPHVRYLHDGRDLVDGFDNGDRVAPRRVTLSRVRS